eukprot:CAMPEP_0173443876 /NCGR_PEP_ID=MMETSP1357-20121228/30982_1 /TAXON_ID=77926 /ORGANISM="Hemiselmis rufescens, Strain PCC563" /LENGTH=56 /DNA_ID=CAMNT_0014409853 /DNA_START=326 /DNA_END=496 /DNA_ORIENTATION=-
MIGERLTKVAVGAAALFAGNEVYKVMVLTPDGPKKAVMAVNRRLTQCPTCQPGYGV